MTNQWASGSGGANGATASLSPRTNFTAKGMEPSLTGFNKKRIYAIKQVGLGLFVFCLFYQTVAGFCYFRLFPFSVWRTLLQYFFTDLTFIHSNSAAQHDLLHNCFFFFISSWSTDVFITLKPERMSGMQGLILWSLYCLD